MSPQHQQVSKRNSGSLGLLAKTASYQGHQNNLVSQSMQMPVMSNVINNSTVGGGGAQ